MNLYVSNLGFDMQDADLRKLFETYGVVQSAKVIIDKVTGRSRGFGFVEMQDTQEAEQAVSQLNGVMAGGRSLKVNEARPRDNAGPKRW